MPAAVTEPVTDHTVRKLVKRAGQNAGIDFPVHPHMLRHACGYKLANDGHDTRALQHSSGTRTFSTRCVTPSLRRIASKGFGRIDRSR